MGKGMSPASWRNRPETPTPNLISDHLVEGDKNPGVEIGIQIDQTLTQDATGTMVMLELEAMGLERARTELSAQYVDHILIQEDSKNPDDHRLLLSACRRFRYLVQRGRERGQPSPAHGALRSPGQDDARIRQSHASSRLTRHARHRSRRHGDCSSYCRGTFFFDRPEVWGVRLEGELAAWVSAKDVILEMLRCHGVRGGIGRIVEYHGPGGARLSAMDHHVIANMGAELGATVRVFPSDEEVRRFLASQGRADDWGELGPDPDAV